MSRFAAGVGGIAGLFIGGAGGAIAGQQLMIGRGEVDSAATGAIIGAGILVPLLAAWGAGGPCPTRSGVVAGVGEPMKLRSNPRFP